MTELWDLSAYVQEHPEDYPRRWRLAKKLYAANEYLLALEHLQMLQKEWTPKINVRRYVAATLYRLGRYPESEESLERTIAEWPSEMGLYEQLAHVYNVDNKKDQALATWKRALEIQPNHALAQKAIAKLEAVLEQDKTDRSTPLWGLFPADLTTEEKEELMITGTVCSHCGAQNSDEFENCWQCNAELHVQEKSFLNTPPIEVHGPYLLRAETVVSLALTTSLLLLAFSAFLGVRLYLKFSANSDTVFYSLDDMYEIVLIPARLMTGIVLLLCWPFILYALMRLSRIKITPPGLLTAVSGLLLASFVVPLIWLPMPFPILAVFISLVLSLGIILLPLRIAPAPALIIWVGQAVLIWLIGTSTFWLTESYRYGQILNPVRELNIATKTINGSSTLADALPTRMPGAITPIEQKINWKSTGSDWLDAHISLVEIAVRPEGDNDALRFQIFEGSELRYHEDLKNKQQITVDFPLEPNTQYEFRVHGKDNEIVPVIIRSLLPYEFVH